jgi:hypothetical protein
MLTPSRTRRMPPERRSKLDRLHTQQVAAKLFEDDLHVKRVESLANGVTGVLRAAALSVHTIGAAYSEVAGTKPRFGVKQVDRFLSNRAIDVEKLTPSWAAFVVGARKEVVVALDWTEFDKDDHATLCADVVTRHGRATPLTWMTVKKSTLEGKRGDYEMRLIERLPPVSEELSSLPISHGVGGRMARGRYGRQRGRVQRGLQGQHGEEDAAAGRAFCNGSLGKDGDLSTDLVEVAARCEGEGRVRVEARCKFSPPPE